MDRSSDTTTFSPTPFSPFSSSNSFGSEGGTSDEPADLGQLSAVFEALRAEFQPRIQTNVIPRAETPTSSLVVSASDGDGEEGARIVWSTKSDYASYSDSDGNGDYIGGLGENDDGIDQPSLGYLDDVLGFLAAERAKFTAQREAGLRGGTSSQSQASTSENAWRHVIEPRRKRRRKRGKHNGTSASASVSSTHVDADADGDGEADAEGVATPVGDALDGSSSGEYWSHGKSMPATPPHGTSRRLRSISSKGKGKDPVTVTIPGTTTTIPLHPKLAHSRSTPSLRVTIPSPPDARVLRLRTLATKLRMLFVEDARHLSSVLLNDVPEEDGFIDPRGRPPEGNDPLVHVFIDHSNILIGFLNHLRRYPIHPSRRAKTHLSHAALTLILERGRPVTRRVLATSSPLYQPMDGAERLGYEVRVYARVPDLGDGLDRATREVTRGKRSASGIGTSTGTGTGTGTGSADSDPGPNNIPTVASSKSTSAHSRSSSLTMPSRSGVYARAPTNTTPGGRVKYREQGVDELLQLKLHQAIADADSPPPPGSTIVLATGDGNAGQFNADGFLGAVRTALKKGWRVELYAWEYGLSKAWVKEFGAGCTGVGTTDNAEDARSPVASSRMDSDASAQGAYNYADRFRIVGLEKFAQDLLEIP
ncbi:uncharacterized protein FOMMEDRAFT_164754 [Fomitiporia mediterranea MF3/22]|uniref:uncharacterized protein n=1 Tax=Fomitiporia mediterranea (strain MF3/22) TaxID=694068 RepID=UPI00044084C2|nr:uncharacterized protein FOMMEDRAFT_164754 [Fomitiporia mediterranea MF3/22]EJD07946.1 hypothetical protein FOMMEDRAFT_164754 [Fomitiporia mediterranea MF3/22]